MQNIKVSRYRNPGAAGWAGYMEPADKSWIGFIGLDGRPLFFLNRDPASGAIIGDDPAKHEADIAAHAAEGGLRTGMRVEPGGIVAAWVEPGEPMFPLGVDGTGGVGISVEGQQWADEAERRLAFVRDRDGGGPTAG